MEEQYAIISKKVALVSGLVCFLVFMAMIYPALEKEPEQSTAFKCGTITPKGEIEGKILFINNCAQCHNKNMKDKLTGPPLHNWREFWADENELFLFLTQRKISKSKQHRTAYKALYKEYAPITCVLFPHFKEEEITQIASYINQR